MTDAEKLTKTVTPAVLEEVLNEKVMPYLNGTISSMFSRSDIIDTTEKMIGSFNGKPWYQRWYTYNGSATIRPAHDTVEIASIDSTFNVTNVWGICTWNNEVRALPFTLVTNNNQVMVNVDKNENKLKLITYRTSGEQTLTNIGICIRYTKTTDSTIKIGTANDYSLDETWVGYWIDGSKLYQKTINFGAMPNATEKVVAHGISNIDKAISISGFYYSSSMNGAPLPFVHSSLISSQTAIYVDTTNVHLIVGTDRSSYNAYITLQYTKTSQS